LVMNTCSCAQEIGYQVKKALLSFKKQVCLKSDDGVAFAFPMDKLYGVYGVRENRPAVMLAM